MSAAGIARAGWVPDRDRLVALLDRCVVQGSIILIPYDLPVVHQACVPLAALAAALMILRGDFAAFLDFLRGLAIAWTLSLLVSGLALFSIFTNMTPIMQSAFQGEVGWGRALVQGLTLLAAMVYPFYLAFCLRRHGDDWKKLVTQAAWWSLPIPFLVGYLQIANLFHVPGLAHLPYIGGAYEGGFWRLTSVARESSWFGSFACVVLPFLVMDLSRLSGIRRLAGLAAIATILLFVMLGTSKSAYAALVAEAGIGGLIYFAVWRPWRVLGKAVLALLAIVFILLLMIVFAPALFEKISMPVVKTATLLYRLFEPLLLGNTHYVSIGTRFGMSAAGTAMGEDFPLSGVGLGQFGFHAYNYTPLWGMNSETVAWLSNDVKGWPSTSNLYTRLMGEIGLLGVACYIALRAILLFTTGVKLLRRDSKQWSRDLSILAMMVALVAFDFHRDSFINLDVWFAMAMAMAVIQRPKTALPRAPSRRGFRIFQGAAAAAFCLSLGALLLQPSSHMASTTIIANKGRIVASPGDGEITRDPTISVMSVSDPRFDLFRTYWGSVNVAEHIIRARPDLVRLVMGGQIPAPDVLADYLNARVTVLMADKQTTLTLQYRNADAGLAKDFLSEAVMQTDRAIAQGAAARGDQAGQLMKLIQQTGPNLPARQVLLARAAALSLQSSFDGAGDHPSFTFVEHPGILPADQSPRPLAAFVFALGLALLTGAVAAMASWLWPHSASGGRPRRIAPASAWPTGPDHTPV